MAVLSVLNVLPDLMELTEKDIKKINSIARVLGNALSDIQELAAKVESGHHPESSPKRRNLKQERVDKYQYLLASGQMRRNKK